VELVTDILSPFKPIKSLEICFPKKYYKMLLSAKKLTLFGQEQLDLDEKHLRK
jgi:hypothetical protein